jgi:hypothetical protein
VTNGRKIPTQKKRENWSKCVTGLYLWIWRWIFTAEVPHRLYQLAPTKVPYRRPSCINLLQQKSHAEGRPVSTCSNRSPIQRAVLYQLLQQKSHTEGRPVSTCSNRRPSCINLLQQKAVLYQLASTEVPYRRLSCINLFQQKLDTEGRPVSTCSNRSSIQRAVLYQLAPTYCRRRPSISALLPYSSLSMTLKCHPTNWSKSIEEDLPWAVGSYLTYREIAFSYKTKNFTIVTTKHIIIPYVHWLW